MTNLPEDLQVQKAFIEFPGDPDVGIQPRSIMLFDLGIDLRVFGENARWDYLEEVRGLLRGLGTLIHDAPCSVYFDFEAAPKFKVVLTNTPSTVFGVRLLRHLMGLNMREGMNRIKQEEQIELFLRNNKGETLIPPVMSWEQATHLRQTAHDMWRGWQLSRLNHPDLVYPPVMPEAPEELPTIEIFQVR